MKEGAYYINLHKPHPKIAYEGCGSLIKCEIRAFSIAPHPKMQQSAGNLSVWAFGLLLPLARFSLVKTNDSDSRLVQLESNMTRRRSQRS